MIYIPLAPLFFIPLLWLGYLLVVTDTFLSQLVKESDKRFAVGIGFTCLGGLLVAPWLLWMCGAL
jgi:hypothetical protein